MSAQLEDVCRLEAVPQQSQGLWRWLASLLSPLLISQMADSSWPPGQKGTVDWDIPIVEFTGQSKGTGTRFPGGRSVEVLSLVGQSLLGL